MFCLLELIGAWSVDGWSITVPDDGIGDRGSDMTDGVDLGEPEPAREDGLWYIALV